MVKGLRIQDGSHSPAETNPYGAKFYMLYSEACDMGDRCMDCGSSRVWVGVDVNDEGEIVFTTSTWCDVCQKKLELRQQIAQAAEELKELVEKGDWNADRFEELEKAEGKLSGLIYDLKYF